MKVCSLFSGIGGIDLGFIQAGFEIVWANEKDHAACKTYRHYFGDDYLVEGDIKRIPADSIPNFDVLAAGFPCQPFSIAGKQRGFEDRRGNLFFEITRIIDAKRPKIVFLENVPNLIEHNKETPTNKLKTLENAQIDDRIKIYDDSYSKFFYRRFKRHSRGRFCNY